MTRKGWNRKLIVVDKFFAYNTYFDIISENKDHKQKNFEEYRQRKYWSL